MIAVNTNVVVRMMARDDPTQQVVAARLFASASVYIPLGVLIEVEWVLRSSGWPRARVNQGMRELLKLDTVTVPFPDEMRWALERHAAGADLADMLHIAAARDAERFATFDERVVAGAGDMPPVPVELLAG